MKNNIMSLVIFMVLLVFASGVTLAIVDFFESDEGYFIQVDTIFSDYINNFLLNDPRVESLEFLNNETTIIKLVDEDAYNELLEIGVIDYLETLENVNNRNIEYLTIFPDLQPAPICVLDISTGLNNGLYSLNDEVFILPNDPRCPNV